MKSISVGILLGLGLVAPSRVWAMSGKAHGFEYSVEPIVGYELTRRTVPTPRIHGMLIYGARVTAGRPHVSVEAEYTRGTDSESFTSPSPQSVSTTQENARLGIRSTFEAAKWTNFVFRAGGAAGRMKQVSVDAGGVSSTQDGKWDIRPYAGTGLSFNVSKVVSASLEASYVFRSLEDWRQNTVQWSGSVRMGF